MSNPQEEIELYLEESREQLAALLTLADDVPLNLVETRRLLHAMEGAAGVMQFEGLRLLIPRWYRDVERTGDADQLRKVVAALHQCNDRIEAGESPGSVEDLAESYSRL